MILHHPITVAAPLVIFLAEVTPPFSWTQALLVYGPLGLWVAWFVIRDRLDREERKQERIDQERRHQENLGASKAIESAFRTNTESIIIGISAMKTVDQNYSELLAQIGRQNKT